MKPNLTSHTQKDTYEINKHINEVTYYVGYVYDAVGSNECKNKVLS